MILDETIQILKQKMDFSEIRIKDMHISDFYTIIQLSNNSVGTGMNYFKFQSKEKLRDTEIFLKSRIKSDPLFLKFLFSQNTKNLLKLSLKTALISALSADWILEKNRFEITKKRDMSIFSDINSAVIVGFGGEMEFIIRNTGVCNIHVSDLHYDKRRNEMDDKIKEYRKAFPNKKITISKGYDNAKRINDAELVSITGSALCNGTMEELLGYACNCKKIIVQGQSSAIYPEIFFRNGVSLVATMIKPKNFLNLAITDFRECQKIMEGTDYRVFIKPMA